MANPQVQTLVFIAGVTNGVGLSQTPVAAGALTLNGSLVSGGVATFDAPRRVMLASAANDSARTFTVTGTGRASAGAPFNSGPTISETVVIPNGTAIVTKQDFATVTGVSVDAATAGAIIVGSSDGTDSQPIGSGPWIVTNIYVTQFQLDEFVTVAAASPSTWSIEVTPDDPNVMAPPGGVASSLATATPGTPPFPGSGSVEARSFSPPQAWAAPASLTNKSAAAHDVLAGVPFAWRLTILSGTTPVTAQGIQAGITN